MDMTDIFGGWSLFAILSLVDIQLGKHLYYSEVSYDLTTRVSFLYQRHYASGCSPDQSGLFRRQLCSPDISLLLLVYPLHFDRPDWRQVGGCPHGNDRQRVLVRDWANEHHRALFAAAKFQDGAKVWKSALTGIGALTISGLDILPILILMILIWFALGKVMPEGDIEPWNEAWVGRNHLGAASCYRPESVNSRALICAS